MSRVVFLVVMVIAILAVADAQTKPKPKSKPATPTATTVAAEPPLPRGSDMKEGASQAEKAAKVFGEIMATPDKGIPTDLLNKAECVAVFPGVIKAGFIVGGKAGRGVASCRTPSGWSAPAFLEIKGGSVGLQIGGSETQLVLLFMNTSGLKKLVSNKVELGADASVAARYNTRDRRHAPRWLATDCERSLPFESAVRLREERSHIDHRFEDQTGSVEVNNSTSTS